jgi:hypothetical protein
MRWIAFSALIALPFPSYACSFCGGNPAGRSTLREEYSAAAAVVVGTLKNPQLGSDPTTGTTEFHFTAILKNNAIIEKRAVIVLPKYVPAGEVVIFFADRKGEPDPVRTQTSNAAIANYLAGTAKIDGKDIAGRLGFAFKHLDSGDETVADDAFMEFAKASDADILKAKAHLDATKLKLMLKNPKTPAGRLGVYALLLGLCGEKTDAAVLAGMLHGKLDSSLGGILTGMTLLDANAGWPTIAAILCDTKRDFGERLSARSAVQYFHATRLAESKAAITATYKALLQEWEIADLAIEDLRRWQLWELTPDVLKLYGAPKYTAKVMRNAILRYALSCPEAAAKEFIAAMRKQDAAMVGDIEERLKQLEK